MWCNNVHSIITMLSRHVDGMAFFLLLLLSLLFLSFCSLFKLKVLRWICLLNLHFKCFNKDQVNQYYVGNVSKWKAKNWKVQSLLFFLYISFHWLSFECRIYLKQIMWTKYTVKVVKELFCSSFVTRLFIMYWHKHIFDCNSSLLFYTIIDRTVEMICQYHRLHFRISEQWIKSNDCNLNEWVCLFFSSLNFLT